MSRNRSLPVWSDGIHAVDWQGQRLVTLRGSLSPGQKTLKSKPWLGFIIILDLFYTAKGIALDRGFPHLEV